MVTLEDMTVPLARQLGFEGYRDLSPRALAARDQSLLDGLEVDYFEEADFEPRVLAAAVRVGGTRLIDNVVLEGDPS